MVMTEAELIAWAMPPPTLLDISRAWATAVHEAGHAVAARVLGMTGIIAGLNNNGDGGACEHAPVKIKDEFEARRQVVILYSGMLAEKIYLPQLIRDEFPTDHTGRWKGEGSDEWNLIGLVAKYTPPWRDVAEWDGVARQRAISLLSRNFSALVHGFRIIHAGYTIDDKTEPLKSLKVDLSYARPF